METWYIRSMRTTFIAPVFMLMTCCLLPIIGQAIQGNSSTSAGIWTIITLVILIISIIYFSFLLPVALILSAVLTYQDSQRKKEFTAEQKQALLICLFLFCPFTVLYYYFRYYERGSMRAVEVLHNPARPRTGNQRLDMGKESYQKDIGLLEADNESEAERRYQELLEEDNRKRNGA